VRIALDSRELAEHPLQIGLSMQVEVDTHDRNGERLPQMAQTAPAYTTAMYDAADAGAAARVKAVIAANDRSAGKSGSAARDTAGTSVARDTAGSSVAVARDAAGSSTQRDAAAAPVAHDSTRSPVAHTAAKSSPEAL